jgi:micrococcal nuclease
MTYQYNAEIIRCVDGDTVDAWIDVGFDMRIKQRLRLHGIDTPETRTKDPIEKKVGLMAKARVQELLEVGKTYPIWTVEKGKFGRYLARIYLDEARNQCVNDMLVEENLALIYFGGSKADVKIAMNLMYDRLRKKGVEL